MRLSDALAAARPAYERASLRAARTSKPALYFNRGQWWVASAWSDVGALYAAREWAYRP